MLPSDLGFMAIFRFSGRVITVLKSGPGEYFRDPPEAGVAANVAQAAAKLLGGLLEMALGEDYPVVATG